ncbi:MAG: hypothetical protein ACFE95_09760 [Candidatus Hodarchaeota archaeon]
MKYKILEEKIVDQEVAYLKKQSDGRCTINAGSIFDSGHDNWFSTEATTEEGAKEYFKHFVEIWFDYSMDSEDKQDKLNDMDIYSLESSEIQNYH